VVVVQTHYYHKKALFNKNPSLYEREGFFYIFEHGSMRDSRHCNTSLSGEAPDDVEKSN